MNCQIIFPFQDIMIPVVVTWFIKEVLYIYQRRKTRIRHMVRNRAYIMSYHTAGFPHPNLVGDYKCDPEKNNNNNN